MDFGPIPLGEALGTVLAHSVRVADGRLRKGLVLEAAHLAALAAAGLSEVTVARLGAQDLDENSAALRLAQALVPDPGAVGLAVQAVGTGRVNIMATAPGLARIHTARIHAVNAVDPAITVATVPEWQRLEAGGMVATIKIIPYAVDKASVFAAEGAGHGALSLRRPVRRSAVLIETTVSDDCAAPDKGFRVMRDRLARLEVALTRGAVVAHREAALAAALKTATAELILILTASATSDINDVGPAALRAAGGDVIHFGMPVDPGNLLFLGTLYDRPVIGLPGCAKSPALNGADWVLERVICGLALTGADIQRLGVGGLLKEIPSRPRPRQDTT